jgi:hypothetical protein
MRTLILSLVLGVAGSGAALLTGCDRTVHEETKTRTTSSGGTSTKSEQIKERPDGSVYKEETKTTHNP